MNVQARRAKMVPSAPMGQTNTPASAEKVGIHTYMRALIHKTHLNWPGNHNHVSCFSAGFSGSTCEIDINECASNPCHYGVCKDGVASFTCACRPGYAGRLCEININECLSQPCRNGGTCLDRENSYTCSCPKGTTGILYTHITHTNRPKQISKHTF